MDSFADSAQIDIPHITFSDGVNSIECKCDKRKKPKRKQRVGMDLETSPTAAATQRPPTAGRRPSARHRRAMSAIPRPSTAAMRPGTAHGRPRRPYSAYTKRGGEAEAVQKYDAPESNREWWRYCVKETPLPGAYRIGSFLDDLQKQPGTYRFRDSSRVKSASHQRFARCGEALLPGAYEQSDFVSDLAQQPKTYSFKNIKRGQEIKIGHGYGDKDISTSPTWYNVVDYTEGINDKDVKTGNFKSRVKREISSAPQFRIVKGPGPGKYESTSIKKAPVVSSSFRSKVPRFDGRPNKIPGPGAYSLSDSPFGDPKPLPAIVQHMKKKHDLSVTY